VAETHVSVVVFLGDRAYKVKKAVDLGFVDFTTREARARACHREVELNRRLAPDVYLGVADVIGPDGSVADHLVVMRRMPSERRLSTLVVAGDPSLEDEIRHVSRVVARFHASAARGPVIDVAASPEHLGQLWRSSLDELRGAGRDVVDGATVDRIDRLATRWLTGRRALLEERIAGGHVVDGHGDLLADDIFCLDDGPRLIDCLEFDDGLRWGDVAADVAFLAMDLERLGRPDLGRRFLQWYEELSGEAVPDGLAHHYVAYRAVVRATVACLRGDGEQAGRLLAIAERHLEAARVRLVVVGGPPASGKSTVAAGVGERLGAVVLRSDVTRKELAGIEPWTRRGSPDLYDADHTEATYVALLERAAPARAAGTSVLRDATSGDRRWRAPARDVAAAAVADLTELRCAVPVDVAMARAAARTDDPSDATPAIAARLAASFAAWPEAVAVDTEGSIEASVDAAVAAVR
jgi:aminoglycoside phosphotransferase family enzyme/predicted kinase